MDGSDEEGEEGDDDDGYDDDPPPKLYQAAIPDEACFPIILPTESTNIREERLFLLPYTEENSPMMHNLANFSERLVYLQKTHPPQGTRSAAPPNLGARAENLMHPAPTGGCRKLRRQPSQGCASFMCYQIKIYMSVLNLQKMHPSQGCSLVLPAMDCKTSSAALLAVGMCAGNAALLTFGTRAKNVMHPAPTGGCRTVRRQPSQGCASFTIYKIKIFMSVINLQKMHPLQGGSLTYPAKDCATRPAALLTVGMRARNGMHPQGGCRNSSRQPSEGCASSIIYQITICMLPRVMQSSKSMVKTLREKFREKNQFNKARPTAAQRHNNRSIYNTKTGTQDFQ